MSHHPVKGFSEVQGVFIEYNCVAVLGRLVLKLILGSNYCARSYQRI